MLARPETSGSQDGHQEVVRHCDIASHGDEHIIPVKISWALLTFERRPTKDQLIFSPDRSSSMLWLSNGRWLGVRTLLDELWLIFVCVCVCLSLLLHMTLKKLEIKGNTFRVIPNVLCLISPLPQKKEQQVVSGWQ